MTLISLLSNVCSLARVSEEPGGEASWFSIGWDRPSEAVSLTACKGTEVTGGFSSFDWPSPEQWGSDWGLFGFSGYVRAGSEYIWVECHCDGCTYSALCLSSARIWSLGFRVYLQKKKKKKIGIIFQSAAKATDCLLYTISRCEWIKTAVREGL